MNETNDRDLSSDIVRYNLAIDRHTMKRVGRRGKIREMSHRSRKRLCETMKALRFMSEGHCAVLTLTTTLQCPKQAKKCLKAWIGAMRYRHPDLCGVFNVEFQVSSRNVHYHVVIRLVEPMEIEAIGTECFKVWKRCSPDFVRQAGDCGRVKDWDKLTAYVQKKEEQEECFQKLLPPDLKDGLGSRWWGVFGKKLTRKGAGEVVPFIGPANANEQVAEVA